MSEVDGNPAAGTAGPDGGPTPSISGRETLATYRYLRLGILAAVFMLAISVLYEACRAPGCWQESISAYYYTPVRSIFVGGLLVIGFSLIVIRGKSNGEDIFLNLAGMFAPVVALVPTSGTGGCRSTPLSALPHDVENREKLFAEWINADLHANIQNNMFALFMAGVFAVALILLFGRQRRPLMSIEHPTNRVTFSLLLTIGLLGIGMLLFATSDVFEKNAHYIAAITMFVFLGVVVILNERRQTGWYKRLYRYVWVGMILSLVILLGLGVIMSEFDHQTLWLEFLEISLFATFWVVETKEQWFRIVASPVEA